MIALLDDEVHLWLVDCDGTDAQRWDALLSQHERERSQRFRSDLAGVFIAQRAALRIVLASYLDQPPEHIGLVADGNGKPSLGRDDVNITFNLSHSGGWLLIGLARGRRIGVDVQIERENLRCLDLARRFFAEDEASALEPLDPPARTRLFFALWTLKEAHLKATGEGISGGLKRCRISIEAAGVPKRMRVNDPREGQIEWELRRLDVGEGYAAAVAVEGAGLRIRCERWSLGSPLPEARSLRDGFG